MAGGTLAWGPATPGGSRAGQGSTWPQPQLTLTDGVGTGAPKVVLCKQLGLFFWGVSL